MITQEIKVTNIVPNPDNIRSQFDDAAIEELAISIEHHGLIQPLVVNPISDGKFMVIAGHRRLAAIKSLQDDDAVVPCIVRDVTPTETTELMLVENLQREDISAIDEANAYQQLVATGMTQTMVAQRVGKSISHVSKRLSLLSLPPEIQVAVNNNRVTLQVAQELTTVLPSLLDDIVKDAAKGDKIELSKWDLDRLKRQTDSKKNFQRIEEWLVGLSYVNHVEPGYNYVTRWSATDLDGKLLGENQIIRWDGRSEYVQIYEKVELTEYDNEYQAYEAECERLDQVYASQMREYKDRRAVALAQYVVEDSASNARIAHEATIQMLVADWSSANLLRTVFGKDFPMDEDDDDADFEAWLRLSPVNVRYALTVVGICEGGHEADVLATIGIVKPERPTYPEEPVDPNAESDDDEFVDDAESFVDDEDDDEGVYIDDTPDSDLAYEGNDVDFFDE